VRLRLGSRTAKQLEALPTENQAKEPPKEQPKKMQAAAPPPPASAPPPEPPPPEPVKAEPPPPPEPAKAEPPPKDPIAEKLAALPPPEPEGPSLEELRQKEEQAKAQKAEEERKQQDELKRQEEVKKAEEKRKAEEKKKAEEAKKKLEQQKKLAEEKRKADEARKKQFDADKIAALLNKVPDRSAPPAGSPLPPEIPTKTKGPVAGAPEGRDSQLTASQRSALAAMLRKSVERCWNINSGLEGANRLVPVVEFELNLDGTVRGVPRVVNPNGSPQFQDAANSAVRAVVQCAPYHLPPEHYSDWEFARLRFDPQGMF
jgi:colicin import membrane protein